MGHAELGAESYSSQLRFQGIDAVGFAVVQLPSANALEVDRLVRAELVRLSKTFPPGLKYQVAFNTTQVVDESIKEVRSTLAVVAGERAREIDVQQLQRGRHVHGSKITKSK